MKRRNLAFVILSMLAAGCLSCGIAACKDKDKDAGISYENIVFASQTFDVSNAPNYVVEIGDNKILKVIVDGVELAEDEYIVKNGHFAFAYQNFFQMQIGEHNIKVVFEQGEKEFTLTITDTEEVKIDLGKTMSKVFPIGDNVLPKVQNLNQYQAFDLSYSLTKDGTVIPLTDNGEDFKVSLAEEGDYIYTVSVLRGGQTRDTQFSFKVEDAYAYETGKQFVTESQSSFFSSSTVCSWDTSKNAVKSIDYLGVSNGLVQRAKYAGDNYLEVVIGGNYKSPAYIRVSYVGQEKQGSSCQDGEFYGTAYKQTYIIDMSQIESKEGVTYFAFGEKAAPVWLYSARFVDRPISENVNYSAHVYQKADLWSSTSDTLWKYKAGDIMELTTTRTILFDTEMLKMAASLGYTHIHFEASNTSSKASIHYNENIASNFSEQFNATNATNTVEFEGGNVSLFMDITNLSDSNTRWTSIAGASFGRMIVKKLSFTSEPIDDVELRYDGVDAVQKNITLGDSLDMSKFAVIVDGTPVLNVKWTLEGDDGVNMSNQAFTLKEGTYNLRATVQTATGIGSAYCRLNVVRSITKSEIDGELAAESKMGLWNSTAQIYWDMTKISATQDAQFATAALMKAIEEGYQSMEITAIASNGWLDMDMAPGAASYVRGEASTYEGAFTFCIDIRDVTLVDSYTRLIGVNQNEIQITHAQFIKTSVSANTDYGKYPYLIAEYVMTDKGNTRASVNNYQDELSRYFDFALYEWKTMSAVKDGGTHCISTKLLKDAVASGFTKIELNLIAIRGATAVYYYDNVTATPVSSGLDVNNLPTGVTKGVFVDGRLKVTLDITNVDNIQGAYAYLTGTNEGTIVLESLYFKP